MAEGSAPGSVPAISTGTDAQDMTAILTKTIIPSPVVRWILHARIRHSACNDVVFVGDDFIHVKQVKDLGVVQHIASKNDFDGQIRAANVFNNRKESPDEELFFKVENGVSTATNDTGPPQSLVLTSSRNDLLFIWLATDRDGRHRFVQQTCPMPTFDSMLFQPGQHLAVDPQSRAIAVGALEREVILYSTKPKKKIQHEMRNEDSDWCLVSAQRPLRIHGAIQHMDFLIPPVDDQGAEDEDHIILLVIVVHEGKTRAIRIDWYASSDLHHARVHPSQPLDVQRTVPSLLIPLRNAAFLLIHGPEIKRWQNILTGSATSSVLELDASAPLHPGASPQRPLWVNWCRPRRNHSATRALDYLYLIREDGKMYLLQIGPDRVESSNAGDFDCHVSSACASLGDSRSPDIIALAGDMSSGSIKSIGGWFTATKAPDLSRRDWADMEHMETIPNWASVTDLVVSTLPGRSQRSRDGIFVTSGRQPYGAVTELRAGIEASLSAYFELDGLRSVTDIWALPGPATGNIIVLLSSPGSTRILSITSDPDDDDDIGEVTGETVGLDSNHKTLAAGTTKEGKIVQITERSIHISLGTIVNFEDCAKLDIEENCIVISAAVDYVLNIAVTAVRASEAGNLFALHCYKLSEDGSDVSGDAQIVRTAAVVLESEPLCVSLLFTAASSLIALVSTADGELKAFLIDLDGTTNETFRTTIPQSNEGLGICDNMVTLKSSGAALAVCGLRDGRMYSIVINETGPDLFGHAHVTPFSHNTVKLTQVPQEHASAYAMSGLDTCLLTWDGVGPDTVKIQNIWISDRERPALLQSAISACTKMPSGDQLAASKFGNSFIAVSGDEFMIATLNTQSTVVPRQVPVSGTPNRLIYSELHRCLVCASLRYSVRAIPSSNGYSRARETREICPVIDFIPSRSSEASFTNEFGAGERIYALLEWSLKHDDDKTYSFVLAGGSHTRSSGSQQGRIWFLQPKNKNWEVRGVKVAFTIRLDEPVYALALGEDNCVFVSVGRSVVVYRYSAEMKDWIVASNTVQLASPGLYVTVAPDRGSIQVSTMQDALVTFRLASGVEGTHGDYRLTLQSTSPRADDGLSHLALTSNNQETARENRTVLMSTKYGQLLGLRPYVPNNQNPSQTEILFEAQLPRSLTRLRECNIRPRWKPAPPDGMSRNDIVGCSTDGSIIGLAALDEKLWRRLSWLQRLCEWSQLLSPFSYDNPDYGVGDQAFGAKEWAMPIGLSERRGRNMESGIGGVNMDDAATPPANIMFRTDLSRVEGRHIDGDVLGRLLKQKDPAATLREILKQVAEKDDSVGQWMRTHYEQEMASVDEVVALLRRVLDDWL